MDFAPVLLGLYSALNIFVTLDTGPYYEAYIKVDIQDF